ncbi:unnamed protein product [Medioppia subpectinata]|uniref:Alpha-galactosidase n=1 Tax=Medioppia subpectinata TaxID=1979941 RepID=A0A7R9L0M0_9ACAR|nr:unnamed protein product [Medioppia subpectinata]CAG2112936.1 unnamed protein product [Medioppia subpectinata]
MDKKLKAYITRKFHSTWSTGLQELDRFCAKTYIFITRNSHDYTNGYISRRQLIMVIIMRLSAMVFTARYAWAAIHDTHTTRTRLANTNHLLGGNSRVISALFSLIGALVSAIALITNYMEWTGSHHTIKFMNDIQCNKVQVPLNEHNQLRFTKRAHALTNLVFAGSVYCLLSMAYVKYQLQEINAEIVAGVKAGNTGLVLASIKHHYSVVKNIHLLNNSYRSVLLVLYMVCTPAVDLMIYLSIGGHTSNPWARLFLRALDDGLALTPPMGWLSWERFACQVDCVKYPHSCINEQLYKDMADRFVADGYHKLGYEYINIDDCWSEKERDANHRLVADRKRFPSGIKALADYMHSKGLKLGIYGDVGNLTCGQYPGQNNHTKGGKDFYDLDAQTIAEWGVDSFKSDGCWEEPLDFDVLYPKMGKALNATGHKMLFICEWPFYQYVYRSKNPDYEAIAKTCHVFRNYNDVTDSWASIDSIIKYYGDYNELFKKYNGPGHWSDPDELTIGNWGLSWEQSRTQMAMWCMWSSPLYMSTDLRKLKPEFKAILQNKALIEVDQDKHGIMATRVFKDDNRQVWVKPVEPIVNGEWSYAVAYLNKELLGDAILMSHKVTELIPTAKPGVKYEVHDLFLDEGREVLGTLTRDDSLELMINTAGAVRMVKLLVKK